MTNIIQLTSIKKSDHKFLYELLSERKQITNIEHKKMPTYDKHIEFVNSKPYSKWYIITSDNDTKIGTIYLTKKNEVGIFLKKQFNKKGLGTMALKLLLEKHPKSYFLANINPKNKKSIDFFKKNGFTPYQITLKFQPKK